MDGGGGGGGGWLGGDERLDRLQLSVLLDAGLVVEVRAAARSRGMTVAAFVERALEVGLRDGSGVGSAGGGGVAVQGGGERGVGGRGRVDDSVESAGGGGLVPDWDSILAAGRANKVLVGVRDPIEEIA